MQTKYRVLKQGATLLMLGAALQGHAQAETVVKMWVHAGPGLERNVYAASVKAFNDRQKDIRVELVALPEGSYGQQVDAAALANKLPCVLDFDGPSVYNYAWTGKLVPLDGFPELAKLKKSVIPTILHQGTYNGKLYSLGQFDSGLAIWGNKKLLDKAGVRIPTSPDNAWTGAEFDEALKKLKAAGVAAPLDMKFNYGIGEWFTYGFSPILQSFGGDLINRKGYKSAEGVLNGPNSVKALTALQNWVKQGYVNAATRSDSDFVDGKSALSYVGHWTFEQYKQALKDDLVLIPMPKFGGKAVTGAGSWNFGITTDCKAPQAAAKVIAHLMSKDEVLRITEANGAVPAERSALAAAPNFAESGPLRLYVEQINKGIPLVRPETPAYPVITTAFAEAVNNIVNGAEVKKELDKAVKKIDQNIEDNKGYPVK